jgi:hypothetical protein
MELLEHGLSPRFSSEIAEECPCKFVGRRTVPPTALSAWLQHASRLAYRQSSIALPNSDIRIVSSIACPAVSPTIIASSFGSFRAYKGIR